MDREGEKEVEGERDVGEQEGEKKQIQKVQKELARLIE